AVAPFFLGVKLLKASIVPDPQHGTPGTVHNATFGVHVLPDVVLRPQDRVTLERHIRVCLAGPLAEQRVRGRGNWAGAYYDRHQAVKLSSYINGGNVPATEK